jgi:hypothetical protein
LTAQQLGHEANAAAVTGMEEEPISAAHGLTVSNLLAHSNIVKTSTYEELLAERRSKQGISER